MRPASSDNEPRGRGRLSSLDQIPDEAQDDVVWAMAELNKRQRTQDDIRGELNERLRYKDVEPISKSAFNRKAVRISMVAARIAESRALFAGIADQFSPDSVDETNIVIGELIKIAITELLDGGIGDTKGAQELAKAYLATIQAQKVSMERRQKLTAEFKDRAEAAIDKLPSEKGITSETKAELKRQIFGVRE